MSPETAVQMIDELRRELASMRRELSAAQRAIKLIRPHLFAGSEDAADAGLFAVQLFQTGGSAGDRTTKCSFTYRVFAFTGGAAIANNVPLTGNGLRIVNATMTAATWGIACYSSTTGALSLVFADERVTQKNC